MSHGKVIGIVWIALVALTLGSAWLGEGSDVGSWAAVALVLTMAVKGRLVIDHFLELATCNRRIRRLMRLYFYVLPGLTLATYFLGETLVRLSAAG